MKKSFPIIIFILSFFAYSVYGCKQKMGVLTDFDQTEYVFIGEVVGYAEPLQFKKVRESSSENGEFLRSLKEASGLIVKVKQSVYLPETPKTHFEVFPIKLGSACDDLGALREELEKNFPKNSEILVVAKKAEFFPYILADGNFRLENRLGRTSLLALNSDENKQKLTSIESIFDYRKTNGGDLKYDDYNSVRFEIRKDLLRLKNAKTRKDRQAVLDRFFNFYKSRSFIDFYGILKKYSENKNDVGELYEKYLKSAGFSDEEIQKEMDYRRKREEQKAVK